MQKSEIYPALVICFLLMSALGYADSKTAAEESPSAKAYEAASSVISAGTPAPDPVASDPAAILRRNPSAWRQPTFEVYRWKSLPGILIFDTDTYETQAAFFKRLAFFTEKQGYTGRISSAAALSDKKGYNAHNYHASDLARYFSKISASMLLPEEKLLRDILLRTGTLIYKNRSYYGTKGGVISISRSSTPSLRKLLLVHELSHAVYYASAHYRQGAWDLWMELLPAEQFFWSLFLYDRSYNTRDISLVVNEYQAYLLQQPSFQANGYFRRQIEYLRIRYPSYAPFLSRFAERYGRHFSSAASRLENLLQTPLSPGEDSFAEVRRKIFSSS